MRSYLGVPLQAKGEVIGTIGNRSRQPGSFDQDHLRVLESTAVQAAVAIQNAQEVKAREKRLKQQIEDLTVQIDVINSREAGQRNCRDR